MSIEQALEKVLSWEFGTDPERYRVRDYIQADLDALVREVRAELPCYRQYALPLTPTDVMIGLGPCPEYLDFIHLPEWMMCPSCAARAGREVLKVEAG